MQHELAPSKTKCWRTQHHATTTQHRLAALMAGLHAFLQQVQHMLEAAILLDRCSSGTPHCSSLGSSQPVNQSGKPATRAACRCLTRKLEDFRALLLLLPSVKRWCMVNIKIESPTLASGSQLHYADHTSGTPPYIALSTTLW